MGVISVSYFWDSEELYDHQHDYHSPYGGYLQKDHRGTKERSLGSRKKRKAGTGMGRPGRNPVRYVDFHFDEGMYSKYQALKIRYRFSSGQYTPEQPYYNQPWWWKKKRYAPEMP